MERELKCEACLEPSCNNCDIFLNSSEDFSDEPKKNQIWIDEERI